ncbi:hypothetical protein [Amycolatopsis taiwanensis]|uniref:hypothetical protein n=1 Tax=Amycolatopsis taiwanensis TaxID=342230 RepID=UPI0004817623|nr:hypothetical protein [Amycolatopsis taiwanensis]
MPDRQLQWLRRDLRRTIDRMEADKEHLQEILDEIERIEHEIIPRRRRFGVIQGGAAVIGASVAETVKWIRQHPTATVMVGLASICGIVGGTAFTPAEDMPPPVIALPAPVIPRPQTTTSEAIPPPTPAATPSRASDEPTTQSTRARAVIVERSKAPWHASKPHTTPPPSTSPATLPTTPPDGPASEPPSTSRDHRCGGIHVAIPPLADVCLLD